jgi:hypothetical protein
MINAINPLWFKHSFVKEISVFRERSLPVYPFKVFSALCIKVSRIRVTWQVLDGRRNFPVVLVFLGGWFPEKLIIEYPVATIFYSLINFLTSFFTLLEQLLISILYHPPPTHRLYRVSTQVEFTTDPAPPPSPSSSPPRQQIIEFN